MYIARGIAPFALRNRSRRARAFSFRRRLRAFFETSNAPMVRSLSRSRCLSVTSNFDASVSERYFSDRLSTFASSRVRMKTTAAALLAGFDDDCASG